MKDSPQSAFVPHDIAEPVRGAASGPLAGLTFAVKDSFDVAGARTGAGSPAWLEDHRPATKHAEAVARLLGAGASVIGKTVCDEFFYSVSGANAHYGTPRNPRAPGRLPGGSSSGSAVAASAGACDFALGGDTGGSVRIPAAFCGIFGIRTTHGRVSAAGSIPMAPSFDTIGWFASAPGVFRCIGDVLLDGDAVDAPVTRMLVAEDALEQADAEVVTVLRSALRRMRGMLPDSEPARVSRDVEQLDAWREAFRVAQGFEVWQTFGDFFERVRPSPGPGVAERMAFARSVTAEAAAAARVTQAEVRAHIEALVPPGTILAMPTAPCIAPLTKTGAADLEHFRVRVMRLTCLSGLSGLPQVTLPVGLVEGCPVGLSFIGWRGGDEALLALAGRLARFCAP